ncbi:hypothetical protein [Phytohabitans flavus]|uniref:hypothetical protein n=1 Tax=Phytohabitans flavus TaxID=1076124 RepID=UPI002F965C40
MEAVEDPARPFVLGVQWHPEVEGTSGRSRPWWTPHGRVGPHEASAHWSHHICGERTVRGQ